MEVTSFYIPNYPRANNVKFITVMIYRMYPEYTIEFREIMPRPGKQEGQQPQHIVAEVQSEPAKVEEAQPKSTKAEAQSESNTAEIQAESKKAEAQPESAKAEAQPAAAQSESGKTETQSEQKESAV